MEVKAKVGIKCYRFYRNLCYYYYDCTGQAATADRALIYNKSLINYGTHN